MKIEKESNLNKVASPMKRPVTIVLDPPDLYSVVEKEGEVEEKGPNDVSFDDDEYQGWYKSHDNAIPIIKPKPTETKVDPGFYNISYSEDIGYFLKKRSVYNDELIFLPIPQLEAIYKDITSFWLKEDKFRSYKLTYKRGILLHGKPGCGKTFAIKIVCDYLINKKNGIVFQVSDSQEIEVFQTFITQIFRKIEPNTPIVVIIEDFDGIVNSNSSNESRLLNLLDGSLQMDNVVYIATTNYPERLQERFLNRPSRFDRRYEIPVPGARVRKAYLEAKIKQEDLKSIDLKKWVKETKSLTIAHLKELIVSVCVLGNDFDESIKILKDMSAELTSEDYESIGEPKTHKAGFNSIGSVRTPDWEDEDWGEIDWGTTEQKHFGNI